MKMMHALNTPYQYDAESSSISDTKSNASKDGESNLGTSMIEDEPFDLEGGEYGGEDNEVEGELDYGG